jgi:hypothetical protein
MTSSEVEYYPVRRFRVGLARLAILLLLLIILGLLSHRTTTVNRAVWKTSPYGDSRDAAIVRAGH